LGFFRREGGGWRERGEKTKDKERDAERASARARERERERANNHLFPPFFFEFRSSFLRINPPFIRDERERREEERGREF